LTPEAMDVHNEICKQTLPQTDAGGSIIEYPWDLVERNAAALREDGAWFRGREPLASGQRVACVGPKEDLLIAEGARIDAFVVADTRSGPVIIDRGANVQAFSRLEGPCYIGQESWILAAKIRGGTIGPQCRVGGEFETSIIQGCSNKYHDGFLGHSY